MEYIRTEKGKGCLFCKRVKARSDEENLIVYRGKTAFVMMNRFPYNNGHVMIIPNRHCEELSSLNDRESQEIFLLLKESTRILKENLGPHGFNVGINLGHAGGAGEAHLHIHIVPRWKGDTNFMPIIGETKVLPECLLNTCRALTAAYQRIGTRKRKGARRR
jgi:ATP adenylyltransferase